MKKTKKPGPPLGSRNAAKDDPATSHIHLRCTPAEKAEVVKAAGGRKLSDYIRERLGLGKGE